MDDLRNKANALAARVRKLHPAFSTLPNETAYYEARHAICERAFGRFISINAMDADDMNRFNAAAEMMLGESEERKYNRTEFEYQMQKV